MLAHVRIDHVPRTRCQRRSRAPAAEQLCTGCSRIGNDTFFVECARRGAVLPASRVKTNMKTMMTRIRTAENQGWGFLALLILVVLVFILRVFILEEDNTARWTIARIPQATPSSGWQGQGQLLLQLQLLQLHRPWMHLSGLQPHPARQSKSGRRLVNSTCGSPSLPAPTAILRGWRLQPLSRLRPVWLKAHGVQRMSLKPWARAPRTSGTVVVHRHPRTVPLA